MVELTGELAGVPPAGSGQLATEPAEPEADHRPSETQSPPASEAPLADPEPLRGLLRPALAVLANITVLTALLVYFGWRRSETQTRRLGFDESVFGSGTRDYLLRSVGPVLVLLVGVAVAALLWVALDRRLTPYLRAHPPGVPGRGALALGLLTWSWLALPSLVWAAGFLWPRLAFVLFPASIGAGVLLLRYATELRSPTRPTDLASRRRATVALSATALLVGICLFWTASNYAEIEGVRLAQNFVADISRLPGVILHSRDRLHLEGPGVVEEEIAADEGALRYRYRGLRLLEHAGGRFFLVSDGWTSTYGVVFLIRDGDDSVRVDFVRDLR